MTASPVAPVHYRVEAANLHAHLYRVTLTIEQPSVPQALSLPAWIPGSYLVREFSKHLQHLAARQEGKPVGLRQIDKNHWEADCVASSPLVLTYEVYAFDASVRAAWLDAQRGFFNGTSLCLRVQGQEKRPHAIEVVSPLPQWEAATGLTAHKVDRRGFGTYLADDYDELVDCPFELGTFWSAEFKAGGVPHRFVVAGAPRSFDGKRLIEATQEICETAIRFWHGRKRPPFKHYVFLLNAVDDGYGGLEHRNSTALIASRRDLPRQGDARMADGYTTLLGLISHEYFHTWNVKQLRPDAFARYDYTRENYTPLLWFFEGFTSYYDDLLLRRAGLIDDATYLQLLGKTINLVSQTPGRHVQTVAQASFDAWVKYYRQDENTPNATVSYYTKGALVALCLDLSLRAEGHSLDTVMRELYKRCQAGPMREQDVLDELQAVTGRSWRKELQVWVHSTAELPLAKLLEAQGIRIHAEPGNFAQHMGLRHADANGSVQVKAVLRGSAAEQAGLAAGDEWLGLEVGARGQLGKTVQSWRVNKLADVPELLGKERKAVALVSRDKQLLRLPLVVPQQSTVWRLEVVSGRSSDWPAI